MGGGGMPGGRLRGVRRGIIFCGNCGDAGGAPGLLIGGAVKTEVFVAGGDVVTGAGLSVAGLAMGELGKLGVPRSTFTVD